MSMIFGLSLRKSKKATQKGFTIVELLVVIVVIGILAAIVFVSYVGVNEKAVVAAIKSDLVNSSRLLQMYYAEHDTYPTDINLTTGCPTAPFISDEYCLKLNSDTNYTYESATGVEYSLIATKENITYQVKNDIAPRTLPILLAIAPISGTPTIGQTLTAGTLTPSDATATYQWQISTTSNGTYTNIAGATSKTFILKLSEINKFIRVVATGANDYVGTKTSASTSAIASDGNWITIGSQTWGKYNLNVGTMITTSAAPSNNSILEKRCYNNTESNCTTYGGLYGWSEAMQYSTTPGVRGICPIYSHIPTDAEWKTLEMQLGMTQAQADTAVWRGSSQGTQLKPGGSSGMNIPLSGSISRDGVTSSAIDGYSYLWTSSIDGASAPWVRSLRNTLTTVNRFATSTSNGYSVRCLAN